MGGRGRGNLSFLVSKLFFFPSFSIIPSIRKRARRNDFNSKLFPLRVCLCMGRRIEACTAMHAQVGGNSFLRNYSLLRVVSFSLFNSLFKGAFYSCRGRVEHAPSPSSLVAKVTERYSALLSVSKGKRLLVGEKSVSRPYEIHKAGKRIRDNNRFDRSSNTSNKNVYT